MHVSGMQECGKEGNACCPGDSPCDGEGIVCAIFGGQAPECTPCSRATLAVNYASALREQCEDDAGPYLLPPFLM